MIVEGISADQISTIPAQSSDTTCMWTMMMQRYVMQEFLKDLNNYTFIHMVIHSTNKSTLKTLNSFQEK